MSVIFLFLGNIRTSPFNLHTEQRNHDILKSYDKFLFTEEFKSLYNNLDINKSITDEKYGYCHIIR